MHPQLPLGNNMRTSDLAGTRKRQPRGTAPMYAAQALVYNVKAADSPSFTRTWLGAQQSLVQHTDNPLDQPSQPAVAGTSRLSVKRRLPYKPTPNAHIAAMSERTRVCKSMLYN